MKHRFSLFGCVLLLASNAFATEKAIQVSGNHDKAPATKLETFQARTDIVVVEGFFKVATMRGQYDDTIEIQAREFRDASNPKSRAAGISFEVKEAGQLERENTSFVDSDEIDSLLAGIDRLSKIGKDVTSFEFVEAHYRTKGDLDITVFSSFSNNKLALSVSSGRIGKTTSFHAIKDLGKLREAVVAAQSRLQ